MRKQILKFTLWTFLMSAWCLTGCKDESVTFADVDGQNPTMELTTEHIRTEYGKQFTLTGKISDKDGIKSIQLESSELEVNKTIDLLAIFNEIQYEYELAYKLSLPEKSTIKEFFVKITVTDLGNRTIEKNIKITPDGDCILPEISDINPKEKEVKMMLLAGLEHHLSFVATDDKGLDYVEVSIPELDVKDVVKPQQDDLKTISFDKVYTVPFESAVYNVSIKAVDLLNNVVSYDYKIMADKVIDYEKMYLVDFQGNETPSQYVFGSHIPMIHEEQYKYKVIYYSKGNAQIRFVTSKKDFNTCFGKVNYEDNKLTANPDEIQPIGISEAGYYEISIDLENQTYNLVEHEPTIEPYNQDFNIFGSGWYGSYGNGTANDTPILTPNSNNGHLLNCSLGTWTNCIWLNVGVYNPNGGTPTKYWHYYHTDDGFGEEVFTPEGSGQWFYLPVTPANGKSAWYDFEFDTYLERGTLKFNYEG